MLDTITRPTLDELFEAAALDFERYEVVKDLVDECIDLVAQLPPERPPGRLALEGPLLLSRRSCRGRCAGTCCSPWRRFGDRFVLRRATRSRSSTRRSPSSTRRCAARHETDGDAALRLPGRRSWALTWEDLLRSGGAAACPGTPRWPARRSSSSPTPALGPRHAAGGRRGARAQARRRARRSRSSSSRARAASRPARPTRPRTRPGASASRTSSSSSTGTTSASTTRPASSVVHGTPDDWFAPVRLAGRRHRARHGLGPVTRAVLEAARGDEPRTGCRRWSGSRTRKGRGYGKYDAKSHGTPHGR